MSNGSTESEEGTLSQEKRTELWSLLTLMFEEHASLTDEQLASLVEYQADLRSLLYGIYSGFPGRIEEIQRYRVKKKELGGRTTGELQRIEDEINTHRAALVRERGDDLSDAFYEAPPLDSDRNVIRELLDERNAHK